MTNTKKNLTGKKEKKKKKVKIKNIFYYLFIMLAVAGIAFATGMIYQQILIAELVGVSLAQTDLEVNINFNATEFANELNNTFIPAWKSAFNETIHNQLNLTNSTR